jgi:hypothetical protein
MVIISLIWLLSAGQSGGEGDPEDAKFRPQIVAAILGYRGTLQYPAGTPAALRDHLIGIVATPAAGSLSVERHER